MDLEVHGEALIEDTLITDGSYRIKFTNFEKSKNIKEFIEL